MEFDLRFQRSIKKQPSPISLMQIFNISVRRVTQMTNRPFVHVFMHFIAPEPFQMQYQRTTKIIIYFIHGHYRKSDVTSLNVSSVSKTNNPTIQLKAYFLRVLIF